MQDYCVTEISRQKKHAVKTVSAQTRSIYHKLVVRNDLKLLRLKGGLCQSRFRKGRTGGDVRYMKRGESSPAGCEANVLILYHSLGCRGVMFKG